MKMLGIVGIVVVVLILLGRGVGLAYEEVTHQDLKEKSRDIFYAIGEYCNKNPIHFWALLESGITKRGILQKPLRSPILEGLTPLPHL